MIKLEPIKDIPEKLKNEGELEKLNLQKKYQEGERKFDFKNNIYGDKSVKDKLIENQFEKCCFCESKIRHIFNGHVEHFRPKAAWKQKDSDKLSENGYYWLAYDISNLFLCCELCNSRYKKNLFPLLIQNNRANSHLDNLEKEEPLFINPYNDFPEQFITFKAAELYSSNEKGVSTIENLNLNRKELKIQRFTKYEILKTIFDLIETNVDENKIKRAKKLLEEAIQPDAEYSLMIKCAIKDDFKY